MTKETDPPAIQAAVVLGRHSLAYTSGQGIALGVAIANAVLLAGLLTPSSFGVYGLALAGASFVTVFLDLPFLQGTLIRAFGQAEDEDGGEREDEGDSRKPSRPTVESRISFGTGLVAIAIVGAAIVSVVVIAATLASAVLGLSESIALVVSLAACSGALGALWRPLLGMFRARRRPRAHGLLTILRALAVAGGAIAGTLLGSRAPEAAVAGATLGGFVSTGVAVALASTNIAICLDQGELRRIMRRSMRLAPVTGGVWTIQNLDLYVVAALTSPAQVGVYRLASRLGSITSYTTSAVMSAWGPLQRGSEFNAAHETHGRPAMRSSFAFYFLMFAIFSALVGTLVAQQLVALVPQSYSGAASLAALLALAFAAQGVLTALYRASTFRRRFRRYRRIVIGAAIAFPPLCAGLVIAFGPEGAPLATIAVLAVATIVIVQLGIRDQTPLTIPWGRVALAAAGAVLIYTVTQSLPTSGVGGVMVLILASLGFAGVVAILVPIEHRRVLLAVTRASVRSRGA